MMDDYSNLTEEEIKALPLELKICFYLVGWNHHFNPKTVDEWAREFSWLYYGSEDQDPDNDEKHIQYLKEEHARLLDFVQRYIYGYL